jgi:uncharacterized membrane protein YkoI
MTRHLKLGAAVLAAAALGGGAIAMASGDSGGGAGRIDDGADLLPQARLTIAEAVRAAQTAASGKIGEIDLEHYGGRLVFNVDVGAKDVKVDAATGDVLASVSDDDSSGSDD